MELNTGVLDVIEVVMKYSELDFLPYLQGIVENALTQLSNPFHTKNIYYFLRIFYTFITCIKTLVIYEDTEKSEENIQITNNFSETIIHSLLEYYNAKNIDKKLENDIKETKLNVDVPNIEPSEETNSAYTDFNVEGII